MSKRGRRERNKSFNIKIHSSQRILSRCVFYSTVHCTILYCIILHCTVLYCTVLYCTALYCPVKHCLVQVLIIGCSSGPPVLLSPDHQELSLMSPPSPSETNLFLPRHGIFLTISSLMMPAWRQRITHRSNTKYAWGTSMMMSPMES